MRWRPPLPPQRCTTALPRDGARSLQGWDRQGGASCSIWRLIPIDRRGQPGLGSIKELDLFSRSPTQTVASFPDFAEFRPCPVELRADVTDKRGLV